MNSLRPNTRQIIRLFQDQSNKAVNSFSVSNHTISFFPPLGTAEIISLSADVGLFSLILSLNDGTLQNHVPPPGATRSPVWVTGTWRCEERVLRSSAAPWCPRPRGDAPAGWRGRWVSLSTPPSPLRCLSPESNSPETWSREQEVTPSHHHTAARINETVLKIYRIQ